MELNFSNRLKNIMLEKDLSQAQLSKISGIAQSSISDWLKGKYEPKLDKITLIANALNTTPAYLMGWEEPLTDREKNNMLSFFSKYDVSIKNIEDPTHCELYEIVCYRGKEYGEIIDDLYDLYLQLENQKDEDFIESELEHFFNRYKKAIEKDIKNEKPSSKELITMAAHNEGVELDPEDIEDILKQIQYRKWKKEQDKRGD